MARDFLFYIFRFSTSLHVKAAFPPKRLLFITYLQILELKAFYCV